MAVLSRRSTIYIHVCTISHQKGADQAIWQPTVIVIGSNGSLLQGSYGL